MKEKVELIRRKLIAALGTDGVLILDNEVKILINLCDCYLEEMLGD